jgi:hypothetical protein
MRIGDAIQRFERAVRAAGFRKRKLLFWKRCTEITVLLHIQRSSWDASVYFNWGVLPNVFIGTAPPMPEYWALSRRAESLNSPVQGVFERLSSGQVDTVSAEEIDRAAGWLISWMEQKLCDEDNLRRDVLNPESWLELSNHLLDSIIGHWALRELRAPSYYYKRDT